MKTIAQIAFIVLLSAVMISASDRRITIVGENILSATELDSILQPLSVDKDTRQSEIIIQQKIYSLVEQMGYFGAQIDVAFDADVNTYVVTIIKNQKYKFESIFTHFLGDSLTEIDAKVLARYYNKAASQANIQALLAEAVDYYAENGFPFAQIKLLWIEKIVPYKTNLMLELTSGPGVVIDSLIFSGKHNLSRDYLLKKSGLASGQIYNEAVVRHSLDNLNSLTYLDSVKKPDESFFNNFQSCILEYNLNRWNSNQIEGAMGYNPATTNRAGYLFGFLDLTFFNPLGDGKDFRLKWNKPGESSSRFALQLDYPYLLGSNLESIWKLSQERYSDLYLTLTASLEFWRSLSQYRKITGGFSWRKVSPQGDTFNSIYHSRIYESWLGLHLSTTGNRSNIFGQSISLVISYLHKRFYATRGSESPANSINPFKAEFSAQAGFSLRKNMFAVLKLNFMGFSEDEALLSPAEMIKLGGHRTIRGYSEEEFVSPRAVWSSLEMGLYREQSFRAYLFTDLGYARIAEIFSEYQALEFGNQFLYGAGLGLNLSSHKTTLDISVAWNRESGFSQGILYLVVGNKF